MYEWDEEKSRLNFEERNLDFAEVGDFDWDTAVVRQSGRFEEERWVAIGYLGGRLHVVVFAERGDLCHITCMRKASNKKRREYAEA